MPLKARTEQPILTITESNWIPVKWAQKSDLEHFRGGITISHCVSPLYPDVRYAVLDTRGNCLSLEGVWEPQLWPSDRDAAFYSQYRFLTFEAAISAVSKWESTHATQDHG